MEAYADLATCRVPQGAIPWTAAMLYADHKGLEPDVREIMWRVVRMLDATELAWWREQANGGETEGDT